MYYQSSTASMYTKGGCSIAQCVHLIKFIMLAIVASVKRKVTFYGIPSAFVNMDMDKDMLMVLM